MTPKSYYNKAKDYLSLNRSTNTKNYETLKKEAVAQKRTAFEFCIWYDFTLVNVANLHTGVLSCILDLAEKNHISSDAYVNDFRLANLLMQKFLQSDKKVNDAKCEEYLADYSAIMTKLNTISIDADFSEFLSYDRVTANKQMFPFFRSKGINTNLIAQLISREMLAFDCKFHNLVFINRTDTEIVGVEKLGIGSKHFQRLEGIKHVCWSYWVEKRKYISFKTDIQKVIFFDDTIRLLQHLSENQPQENVLYCSLHTDNCLIETYTNTLELLNDDVEIQFNFANKEAIQRFENVKKENNIPEPKNETQTPAKSMPVTVVAEIKDVSKMAWDDSMKAYYDATDDSFWNEDGTEFSPF